MRDAEQKIKILLLYDILQKNTDEDHTMTTVELITALKGYGINATRQTIYEDIKVLNQYGYCVICDKKRSNQYFVGNRLFDVPEIQLLLNAVGAAKFLTEKKTSMLTNKVMELLGESQSARIKEVTLIEPFKHSNEHIYYSIDAITSALLNKKKLSFVYFDYGSHGERKYRKDKDRYLVNPVGMVYSDGNFYLVCFHDKYDDPTNYRIDRMDEVHEEKEAITKREKFKNFDLTAYKRELFSMYTGERSEVSIAFPEKLINVIIDTFGEGIAMMSNGNGEYMIRTKIRVSKTFFSWLTMFDGKIKIHSPENLIGEYRNFLENLMKNVE